MKIEIKNEKQNPFLKRAELNIEIDHTEESTPSKAALQQWVAKERKKDVTSVEVIDIFSDTGKNTAVAHVFLWAEKKVDDLLVGAIKRAAGNQRRTILARDL